jgi:hypothetical protein
MRSNGLTMINLTRGIFVFFQGVDSRFARYDVSLPVSKRSVSSLDADFIEWINKFGSLCLVVRVPGYRSKGLGSIRGDTRFSKK